MNIVRKSGPNVPELNTENQVTYLTYPSISKYTDYTHAFSTRMGGVSEGIYSSMNLSFTRGDDDASVRENFRRFADAVGVSYDSIVMSDQTHTTNVRRVYTSDCGNGLTRPKSFFDTDGLITNEPGVTLFTSYADCVPLFFIDPVHKAIGLSHSGWRGTVGRIGLQTVKAMTREFDTNPADLIAAIGPSICADCYEVSEDVAMEFINEFGNNADKIVLSQKDYFNIYNINKTAKTGKYQLNLWQANKIIMLEAGIQEENISVTNICTCCNPDFLFSHRASHGKRGNLAAILAIK